ncbi:hypothetical protein CEXT_384881 [Caerostris extrusa]|uniref:Uncharacterized protein n=1 Tax=Caerostris extrusa TaxID=172846 RepID=A0AAV4QQH4_CAEEX|nr:hypothetical protein CEXT_384881 [Caerostris extrusa]
MALYKKKKKTSDFGYDLMAANALSSDLNDCDINSSISMEGKRTLSSALLSEPPNFSEGRSRREDVATDCASSYSFPKIFMDRFICGAIDSNGFLLRCYSDYFVLRNC